MTDVDKASVAQLDKQGDHFEILVNCEEAMDFKQGGSASLRDVVVTDEIFKDVKKGEKASEHELEKVFGTSDIEKVSEIIVREGQIQLTTDYKNKLRAELKKKIINMIHKNAIDPNTGHPHPSDRIERAMGEAKIFIDEHKKAEEQIEGIVVKLRPLLPLSIEVKKVEVVIPASYASQCFHVLKSYGKQVKDEWQGDGSLRAVNEVPAGLVDEFFSQLNKIAHGEIESKIL